MIQSTTFAQGIVSFTNVTLENNDYLTLVTDNPGDKLLPVELTYFGAVLDQGHVHLSWATASESNNAGFEVQRRTNNGTQTGWSSLGFIEGQGHSIEPVEYAFRDDVGELAGHTVVYRLKQVDFDGSVAFSGESKVDVPAPEGYALSAYPNPFNPTTTIQYEVPATGPIKLDVFDVQGRRVASLVDHVQTAGRHTVLFDASDLSSGTYIYRLETEGHVLTNTILLVK